MRWRAATPRRASLRSASAAAWGSPWRWSVDRLVSSLKLLLTPFQRSEWLKKDQGGNMGRVAVVTGGTRGIGAAISTALKAAGYDVAATYHSNDEAAQKFKVETGVHIYKWNVSDYHECVAGLGHVEKDIGPVGVLVNNAGITKDGMFHKMTPDQWYSVINTNLNSLFNMCRPVIEGMRERGFGRIINISSVNGQKGQMGQANYSAAKAGEIGFTKALAQEK